MTRFDEKGRLLTKEQSEALDKENEEKENRRIAEEETEQGKKQ